MNKLSILTLFLSLLVVITSHSSETVEGAKKDYRNAKAEIAVQMEELDKKIAELKFQVQQKSSAAKQKTLQEAEEARAKLRLEYEKMKSNSKSNWSLFKQKLALALDKMNSKAQDILSDEKGQSE